MKNIIVTTTNSIEGNKIVRYLDAICANVVIGTNIFSDFAASFTDFFGGRSQTYQNKLELIQKEVTKELKHKASILGANAILGFKLDFDEISGGNKSMFMVSASGTACIIDIKEENTNTETIKSDIISKSQLIHEIKRQNIINAINNIPEDLIQEFKDEWFEFLIEYPQPELVTSLMQRLIDCYKNSNEYESSISKIKQILNLLPIDVLEKEIYDKLLTNKESVILLIKELDLFSPKYALEICNKGKLSYVLAILGANSRQYSRDDIKLMKQIYDKFNNLPNIGKIEMVKGGLLGKDMEKYICPNGHKSNADSEFCCQCELNIKGLSKSDVKKINNFKSKIEVLEHMFN